MFHEFTTLPLVVVVVGVEDVFGRLVDRVVDVGRVEGCLVTALNISRSKSTKTPILEY